MPERNVILTLRIEKKDGNITERQIEGVDEILHILSEAGILDAELEQFLMC